MDPAHPERDLTPFGRATEFAAPSRKAVEPVGRVDRSAESKPKRALPLLFTKRTAQCIPRRLSATKKPTHWLPVDAAKTRFGDVGA